MQTIVPPYFTYSSELSIYWISFWIQSVRYKCIDSIESLFIFSIQMYRVCSILPIHLNPENRPLFKVIIQVKRRSWLTIQDNWFKWILSTTYLHEIVRDLLCPIWIGYLFQFFINSDIEVTRSRSPANSYELSI